MRRTLANRPALGGVGGRLALAGVTLIRDLAAVSAVLIRRLVGFLVGRHLYPVLHIVFRPWTEIPLLREVALLNRLGKRRGQVCRTGLVLFKPSQVRHLTRWVANGAVGRTGQWLAPPILAPGSS